MEPSNNQNQPENKQIGVDDVEAFLNEYGELVKKHQKDFVAMPVFVPNEDGTSWKLVIQSKVISTANQPIKSPFVAQ